MTFLLRLDSDSLNPIVAFFLRRIRKDRWRDARPVWLPKGDIPADPLADFQTKENQLSVWYVDDSKQNIGRVAAALASMRERIGPLDCVLIERSTIDKLGILAVRTDGNSADAHANSNWHYDLKQLSGRVLISLVGETLPHAHLRRRVLPKEIRGLLQAGIQSAQIDPKRLKPSLRVSLGLSPRNRFHKLAGCLKEFLSGIPDA